MEATEHTPSYMGGEPESFNAKVEISTGVKVKTYMPPCGCAICRTQYCLRDEQKWDEFCYSAALNGKDAQELLNKYIRQASDDKEYLCATLQRYGNAIEAWWRRRGSAGRRAFLEQIAPELPKTKETQADYQSRRHSPVYSIVRDYNEMLRIKRGDRRKNRQAFLLPYLNTPTLATECATLLSILHTRSHAPLEDWVPFDNYQLTHNWNCGYFDVQYNRGCVVLFGSEYGKLKSWDGALTHRQDALGFPRAQLLLEAQSKLMGILRQILTKALARIPADPPQGAESLLHCITVARMSSKDGSAWSSYVHQATSTPPKLDLAVLASHVRTRLEDLGDHLWLLQTEPAYFRRYLSLVNQTNMAQEHRKSNWLTDVSLGEIQALFERYWFWQGVLVEIEHTSALFSRFRDHIAPGSDLPQKFESALGALEAIIDQGIDLRVRQLSSLLRERPGFSDLYEHEYDAATNSSITRVKSCPGMPNPVTEYKTHRLWWCLGNLLAEYENPSRFPYAMLFGILDDHLRTSSANERKKMDGIMYERFTDFATMIKLAEALRFHRPSYAKRQPDDCKVKDDRLGWRRICLANNRPYISWRAANALRNFQKTNPPAGGKCGKWLQAYQANHDALQKLWASVHAYIEEWHKRYQFRVDDTRLSMEVLEFWKSPEYAARLKAKCESVCSETENRKNISDNNVFLPLPSTTVSEPKIHIQQAKTKVKKRGEPQLRDQTTPEHPTEIKCASDPIRVSKGKLSVFRRMFPEAVEERSAEVEWSTFVLSMNDAGFSSKNSGGSMVTFESKSGLGSIIFHRPHPSSKLDSIMLQSMGRRMNKWFGWNRETFALIGKDIEAGVALEGASVEA